MVVDWVREGWRVGVQLEGYSDVELLGQGGFSTVYTAHDIRHDRRVALKVLDVEAIDEPTRRRFERECQAMGRISDHPNIVGVLDSGVHERRPYLVMEYYEGGSLAGRIKKRRITIADVLTIGVEISSALGSAHGNNIVHMDVKPENIFVSRWGGNALGDFGISSFTDTQAMRTGRTSFTPAYVAPEILDPPDQGNRAPSAPSDIYSLGATLYAAVTGSPPFPGADGLNQLFSRILLSSPPPITRFDSPSALNSLLASMLAKSPEDRPDGAIDVAQRLREIQVELGYAPTPLRVLVRPSSDSPETTEHVVSDNPERLADDEPTVLESTFRPPRVVEPITEAPPIRGDAVPPTTAPQPSPVADTNGLTIARHDSPGASDSTQDDGRTAPEPHVKPEPAMARSRRRTIAFGSAALLLIASGIALLANTPDETDEAPRPEIDTPTTALQITPLPPEEVRITTSGDRTSIEWSHESDEVEFEVRDLSGALLADGIVARSWETAAVMSGDCFIIAAVSPEGEFRNRSQPVEACAP